MKRLVLAVALTASGCSLNIFGPQIEHWSKRPLVPVPAVYEQWYADVRACWSQRGVTNLHSFQDARWFIADKITMGGGKRARASTTGDDIVITRSYVHIELTVKHEISHHVTGFGDEIHFDSGIRAICDGGQ